MTCPKCGGRTAVLETRESPHGIRRRRRCRACGHRLTTFETTVVGTITARGRQTRDDVPDAAEIAREVADAFEENFRITNTLDALPDDVVAALLEEAERQRGIGNGYRPELLAGEGDEDE